MSEISKYEAYKRKLQGLCDEHDLVFRLRKDKYPFTLTIRPAGGLDAQMSLLEREEEQGFTSPDATITFSMKDGTLKYRMDKTFTIDDALLGKFKNLFKNLYATWTAFFFQDVMERDLLRGRAMPQIDEGEADPMEDADPDGDGEDGEGGPDGEDEGGAGAGEDQDGPDEAPSSDPVPEEDIETAIRIVRQENKATVALLQREMKIGYAKAAKLMDALEERGVVGPFDGSSPREVLPYDVPDEGDDDDLVTLRGEEGESDGAEA